MELNTSDKDENNKIIYDYPTLNGELENLKKKLKSHTMQNTLCQNYSNMNC